MYRIENILARNNSKKTVRHSAARFQPLRNFETPCLIAVGAVYRLLELEATIRIDSASP
jgi:hypothetical protein